MTNTERIENVIRLLEKAASLPAPNKRIRGWIRCRIHTLSSDFPNDADFTPDQANRLGRLRFV